MNRAAGLLSLFTGCVLLCSPIRAEGTPEDEARYLHRLERASEIYFNVGFLYVADGMNGMHEHKDRAATAALLYRGAGFLKDARELNQQAVTLAHTDDSLKYEAPQADPAILQGTPAAREVLSRLGSDYQLRWESFHATLLKDTLDPEKDFIETIAAEMRPVEGQFAGARLKELLELGRDQSAEERSQFLKADALEAVAVAYGLDAENVSVPSTGDGGVFDTKRGDAPPAQSTTPATATAAGTSAAHSHEIEVHHDSTTTSAHVTTEHHVTGAADPVHTLVHGDGVRRPNPSPPGGSTALSAAAQKASDAAALAGAKVRSSLIANAAVINWEMHRALKEFLFAYTVRTQATASPCYPLDASGARIPMCPAKPAGDRYDFAMFDPRENNNETDGPFVPAICQVLDAANNYCQKAGQPGIPEFQGGGSWGVADPIVAAVRNATISVADCSGRTELNQKIVSDLLFGTDPNPPASADADPYPGRSGFDRLGALTRMAILTSRLDTVRSNLVLDLKKSTGSYTVKATDIPNLAASGTMFDRTRAAYAAAQASLRAAGFPDAVIELTENAEKALPLPFALATGTIHVANLKFETKGTLDRGDCFSFREVRRIVDFPYELEAGPDLLEPYTVQISVKSGSQSATTKSAAVPAPVRVGPGIPSDDGATFSKRVAFGKTYSGETVATLTTPRFPNPLIQSDETDSQKQGFTRNNHLGYLRSAALSLNGWQPGFRLAGALSPWELGKYSPPCTYPNDGGYQLQAPLMSRLLDVRQKVADFLQMEPATAELARQYSDDKIMALFNYLVAHKQYDQHFVPDPILRSDGDLLKYARTAGKPFTVAADPNAAAKLLQAGQSGGVCTPDARLVPVR